jgi:hypothetical protein
MWTSIAEIISVPQESIFSLHYDNTSGITSSKFSSYAKFTDKYNLDGLMCAIRSAPHHIEGNM